MDSYAIGVSIMLASNAPQMLNTIATQMLGLHTHVGQINNQFGRMATLIGGVGAALAGAGILKGMAALVEHGSKINHELELMKIQSMDVAEIQGSMAKALEVSGKIQQTTVAENLKHIRELRYAFGDSDKGLQYLEAVSKANVILNSFDKSGAGNKDQVWELVKALEQKGETADPESFLRYIDIMTKATVASGGKVTPAQFQGTFKYGRTAMLGWDDEFVGQFLPRLIQSMSAGNAGSGGSGGPGNALMSAFAKVVQGQMPKKAAAEWQAMGLGEARHIPGSSQSEIVGGMAGAALFLKNPYEWVQSVLMPALAKHGITSQFGITEEISKMFPVRTASQVIAEMALQGRFHEGENSPFEKDAALARKAQGLTSYDELSKGDWQTNMAAFHKQFENLLELLGAPIVKSATDMLHSLNDAMSSVAQWAGKNPETVKTILEVVGALGAGLVVGGVVAVLAALASLAPVAAGIAAAATAISTLIALNWDGLTHWINSVASAVKNFFVGSGGAPAGAAPGGGGNVIETPGGAGMVGPHTGKRKESYNAVPPASSTGGDGKQAAVYMDGRVVGELVTRQIVDRSTRPLEGSAHFDSTWMSPASDVSYA